MTFLRNAWYVALWGQDLPPGELVARTFLNEPVILFRDNEGIARALVDWCPHKFAPLHRGKFTDTGSIRCAYHGLEFDAEGACVYNPHGKTPKQGVRAYPVAEKHSLIWIWMGDSDRADPAAIPDFSILDPDRDADTQVSKRDWIKMEAGYELITDNLLDLSHVSFLHEGILGNEDTIAADTIVDHEGDRIYARRLMENVRVPGLFDLLFKGDGGRVDLWNDIRWDAPGCMMNDAGVTDPGGAHEDGTGIFGTHFLTPETERTTYYHFAAVRQNPRPVAPDIAEELRHKLSELRHIAFAEQDAPIIEAQQLRFDAAMARGEAPTLLAIDKGPVAYKRVLKKLIDAET